MDTKLTLKLDKEVIDRAKVYAANQKVSVSSIVETYLKDITSKTTSVKVKNAEISDFVKSISIGKGQIPDDLDYKKDYYEHLLEKYK